MSNKKQKPGLGEFVTLMALMSALVALAIDAILPALPAIGHELGAASANDNQLIVSILFLGLAFGKLVYGPLSDRTGRKPAVYLGMLLFAIGCFVSISSTSMRMMLIGRFIQGFGLSGPRIVSIALIRDLYSGNEMARVMSFVMSIFILVPTVAPALGQAILAVADWQSIFLSFLVLSAMTTLWFAIRQPETLATEDRRSIAPKRLIEAAAEVISIRTSVGYTLAAGLISGAFLGYLSTAQQLLQEQYELGAKFPIYFAMLALAVGAASLTNARLVMRYGMRRLTMSSCIVITGLSTLFYFVALAGDGHPSLWLFMSYLSLTLFFIGILFGNLNSLAMEPLGHMAGLGATFVGASQTFIAVAIGVVVGRQYDGTVLAVVAAFAVFGALAIVVMRWTEKSEVISS